MRLLDTFRQWLGRSEPVPEPELDGGTDWSPFIWGYTQSFWRLGWSRKASDRASKECADRGLAFGRLRVLKAEQHSVTLGLMGEQRITAEKVREALTAAIRENGLAERLYLTDGVGPGSTDVVFVNDNDPLPGPGCCGFRNGQSASWKEFCSADCWDSSGGLREMRAPSIEALRVLLRTAELLGYPAGSKHYAHESTIRIEDIVVYAMRWEDPATKCRYLDVRWKPEYVRHLVYHGSSRRYEHTEGSHDRIEVLACAPGGDWWPKISINNRPVYSTVVDKPTAHMLLAREKFAREAVRTCSYCGELAVRQFHHVHFEEVDTFGGSSRGGITYGCAQEACARRARGRSAIRTEESPYTQEVWR